jgi:hypothetical protein
MKLTITTLFLLLTTISFAQIPSYVPTNGLVGWWPFNGNANDESGNGNNGTVNGATLTVDRFGVADKAYSFDGVNDFIEIANNNLINPGNISISLWIKPNALLTTSNFGPTLVSKRENSGWGGAYQMNIGGNSFWADWTINGNGGIYHNDLPASSIQVGVLAHLVYTHDNNFVRLYLNGVLVEEEPSPGALSPNTLPLTFATRPGGLQFFNGSLDDIGIWNRALTECEIKDLYYAQLGYSTVDAGADQTICKGDLVTLQGAGGSSLAWDNGVVDGVPFEPAQSGAYVLTGADSLGCIGTDTVQVTVLENASSTINQTAIDSYTLNGQTYTQSGTYTQVVPAANGCDSVITLNLELDFTGIQSHTNTSLQLYPNPVKDIMTLVGLKGEAVSFAVYSVDGKLIKSGQTSGEIQLEDLKKGNYILKIENQALPFVKL